MGTVDNKDSFTYYAEVSLQRAVYPNQGNNLIYTVLGLAEESGEAAGKVKKRERDMGGVFTPEARAAFLKELGDALWYIAAAAREAGSSLQEVASLNLDKTAGRLERGTIHGAGDDR